MDESSVQYDLQYIMTHYFDGSVIPDIGVLGAVEPKKHLRNAYSENLFSNS